ncbi:MAG TPA: polysaccharide deacetylase family protein [Rhodothermales bacterium]
MRRTALGCLERVGALRAIGDSRWRRGHLLVLAYHGISQHDEHLWNGALYMASEVLAERLRILRECGCAVIALTEAVERLYAGTLEPRSVVITFDDGYHDFVSRAYPLLAEYGVPVTVYLPTVSLGWATPSFPLVCSYLLWKANRQTMQLPELGTEAVAVGDLASRMGTVAALLRITKTQAWSRADRDMFVRALAERVGLDYGTIVERRLFWSMAGEDVTRLAAAGVDFQLHTHTHNTPRERVDFAREIVVNRERIERLTGVRPTHFCYPSGNYDSRFLPWLREQGVVSAVTCDPGLASRRTPALMIPRVVDTSTTTSTEFRGWLTGAAALLSRRKSYAKPAGD